MRLTRFYLQRAAQMVDYYSQFHPSVLSIQQFLDFGTHNLNEKKSFTFLRKELPVRLANIMKEINLLPDQLLNTPSVQLVESWYEQSFEEILDYERSNPNDSDVLTRFCEVLDIIRTRHQRVVETMAKGVLEMKNTHNSDNMNLENQIQYFLDRFYMNRISIRMLINQHVLLFGPSLSNHPRHVGCIDTISNVMTVAQDAFENARFLCEQYYLAAPECDFMCHNPFEPNDQAIMTYVPSHLYHILFELIKNALRAVVEFHGDSDEDLPKIQVSVFKGKEDVTIKIADQGGGIARSTMSILFNYMYSTAPRPPSPEAASTTPLAGYGYGLPLSRLYAKYFNGDLWVSSMEGYGTDALVYLKLLTKDATELLPVYNKTSYQRYSSSIPIGDWSDPSQTTGLHGAVHQLGHPQPHAVNKTQQRPFSTYHAVTLHSKLSPITVAQIT